jgi:hypothetical protein
MVGDGTEGCGAGVGGGVTAGTDGAAMVAAVAVGASVGAGVAIGRGVWVVAGATSPPGIPTTTAEVGVGSTAAGAAGPRVSRVNATAASRPITRTTVPATIQAVARLRPFEASERG